MNNWREFLIRSYRFAALPYRQWTHWRWQKSDRMPVFVLFYHRVADEHPNPWSISQDGFKQQIDWLQENFDLISLSDAQTRIRHGNTRPAVSITFDDGYSDNCSVALPMLIERKIPVTYFVTTYHTTHNQPFPHDVEQNQPLAPNSIESLRALANAGVEIGGHTRTHADLGSGLSDEQMFDEVIAATREMESMIGQQIRYFAFPFGMKDNLDPRAFQLLKDHGFEGTCSAYGGANFIGGDPFHLQRIHGDPSLERLKNWLTGDSRIYQVAEYDWQAESANYPAEHCLANT